MKKILSLFLVLLLLLAVTGCKEEVEPCQMNKEIPYVAYCYSMVWDENGVLYNVTGTGKHSGATPFAAGYHFIRSATELEEYAVDCEEWLRREYADDYNWPGEEEKPNRDEFRSWYGGHTQKLTFDETFFATQDLLIVDYCGYGFLELESRPEEIRVENGVVFLQIRYGGTASTTATNVGHILLLPVEKGCSSTEVEYVRVDEWFESVCDVV